MDDGKEQNRVMHSRRKKRHHGPVFSTATNAPGTTLAFHHASHRPLGRTGIGSNDRQASRIPVDMERRPYILDDRNIVWKRTGIRRREH